MALSTRAGIPTSGRTFPRADPVERAPAIRATPQSLSVAPAGSRKDVALGGRYARNQKKQDGSEDELDASSFVTVRLLL